MLATDIADALATLPMRDFDDLAVTGLPPTEHGFYAWWQTPGALPGVTATPLQSRWTWSCSTSGLHRRHRTPRHTCAAGWRSTTAAPSAAPRCDCRWPGSVEARRVAADVREPRAAECGGAACAAGLAAPAPVRAVGRSAAPVGHRAGRDRPHAAALKPKPQRDTPRVRPRWTRPRLHPRRSQDSPRAVPKARLSRGSPPTADT